MASGESVLWFRRLAGWTVAAAVPVLVIGASAVLVRAEVGSNVNPPGRGSTVLVLIRYVAFCFALAVVVRLPSNIRAARRFLWDWWHEDEDAEYRGLDEILLGAGARWVLRLGVVFAAVVVTFLVAAVTALCGVGFSHVGELRDLGEPSVDGQLFAKLDIPVLILAGVSLAALIPTLVVLDVVLDSPPGRRPAVDSRRWRRALAAGARAGCAVTVGWVVALPVVMLQYVVLRSFGAVRGWADGSAPFRWLAQYLDEVARLMADEPLLAPVVLAVVPIFVSVVVHRAVGPGMSVRPDEWSGRGEPPVLVLTSPAIPRGRVRLPGIRRGVVENLAPPPRVGFSALVVEAVGARVPTVLRDTGRQPRSPEVFAIASRDARCTVALVPPTPVDRSELADLAGLAEHTSRLVLVLPPGLTIAEAREPGGYLAGVESHDVFAALRVMDLGAETIVLARSGQRPWKAYASGGLRTPASYAIALGAAFNDFDDTWMAERDDPRAPAGPVELRGALADAYARRSLRSACVLLRDARPSEAMEVCRDALGEGRRTSAHLAGAIRVALAVSFAEQRQLIDADLAMVEAMTALNDLVADATTEVAAAVSGLDSLARTRWSEQDTLYALDLLCHLERVGA